MGGSQTTRETAQNLVGKRICAAKNRAKVRFAEILQAAAFTSRFEGASTVTRKVMGCAKKPRIGVALISRTSARLRGPLWKAQELHDFTLGSHGRQIDRTRHARIHHQPRQGGPRDHLQEEGSARSFCGTRFCQWLPPTPSTPPRGPTARRERPHGAPAGSESSRAAPARARAVGVARSPAQGRGFRPAPSRGSVISLTSPPSRFPAPSLPQVKKFAHKVMKTADVRVDVKLNKHIWSKGIRNVRPRRDPRVSGTPRRRKLLGFSQISEQLTPPVPSTPQVPRRIRVQISRRRNDDEDAAVRHPPPTVEPRHMMRCRFLAASGATLTSAIPPLLSLVPFRRRRCTRTSPWPTPPRVSPVSARPSSTTCERGRRRFVGGFVSKGRFVRARPPLALRREARGMGAKDRRGGDEATETL